jgi:probable rRNA maturation factor
MKAVVNVRYQDSSLVSPRRELSAFTRTLLRGVLREKGLPGGEVTVLYCSPTIIQRLNRDYRGIDKSTDVLSFPAEENPADLFNMPAPYLGDLALCLPICARQAIETDREPIDEIALLLVHGFLHLLGHDHDTTKRKNLMWAEQDRLVVQCTPPLLPFPRIRSVGP